MNTSSRAYLRALEGFVNRAITAPKAGEAPAGRIAGKKESKRPKRFKTGVKVDWRKMAKTEKKA